MSSSDLPPSQSSKAEASKDTTAYQPDPRNEELAQVLDRYVADLETGRSSSREQLLAEHPHIAEQLAASLSGIEFIHHATRPGELPMRLGDFQILSEVGRGGMGVVYEARQLSLNRRVALKVLRFGGAADREAMERFQREAETVAQMHHTNIVPIFAIGNQEGVSYYSMQFIEGRSLAAVLEESQKIDQEVDPDKVAQWGLQAAEALAYAHQRGVIHRDVKPSNLILDPEGQIWLTDFGLAKRLDDATLSMTGAMLGTPRYMSPEQASAMKLSVDQRTDIYSLGATLYELTTGRPLFDADTPHGIISQILTVDPRRPRELRPDLPRDLETIILKCLAKEPGNRYVTAQSLADDLRAFLQGWPIQARRASAIERAARWVRRQRRMVAVAALAATVGALLVGGGITAWWSYRQSRLGYVSLATDGPSLTAEILTEDSDEPIVPSISVPTQDAAALPEGHYRLRLSAAGLLSEMWPLDVNRGNRSSLDVRLHGQWLWPPANIINEDRPAEPIDLEGHTDLITYQRVVSKGTQTLAVQRRDGATCRPIWPADLEFNEASLPAERDLNEWRSVLDRGSGVTMPTLLQPALDFNGDSVRDVVWASRTSASLVAVSGQDGKPLWWSHGRTEHTEKAMIGQGQPRGSILGMPAVTDDLDGDHAPDLVACFVSSGEIVIKDDAVSRNPQVWVATVSGRTGKTLWRRLLPDDPNLQLDNLAISLLAGSSQTRADELACQPEIVRVRDKQLVVLALGKKLWRFDLTNGEEARPLYDIGLDLLRPPQIGDWNGDGKIDVLLTCQKNQKNSLTLISLESGKILWTRSIEPFSQFSMPVYTARNWPLITALHGIGPAEIALPLVDDTGSECSTGIEVVSAANGKMLWQRWLLKSNTHPPIPVRSIIDGPDLDGDGCHEVFVAFSGQNRHSQSHLTVAALSGTNGRTLWRWKRKLPYASPNDVLHPLQWRHLGVDGWPELVVSLDKGPGLQPITFILSAATGRLTHTLPEVADIHLADFNGDGLEDIFFHQAFTTGSENYGRLVVLRGDMPEPWRQLGQWTPAEDYDSDGVGDFLGADGTARSGANGLKLWRINMQSPTGEPFLSPPRPQGDLSGDGIPDVIGFEQVQRQRTPNSWTFGPAISAFSGKDGQKLWTADIGMSNGFQSGSGLYGEYRYPALDWYDLNQDGHAELLVVYPSNGVPGFKFSVLSGHNGKLLWSTPIVTGGFPFNDVRYRPQLADLDGDGTLDLLLCTSTVTDSTRRTPTIRALSGRDGHPLWPSSSEMIEIDENVPLLAAAGDLDGDGLPEAVLVHTARDPNHLVGNVSVLNARDGKKRWSWSWAPEGSRLCPPLLVNLDGDGRREVCVCIKEKDEWQIAILDSQGHFRSRIPLKSVSGSNVNSPDKGFLWTAAEVDGDDREELLYVSDNQLCATHGNAEDTLWRWQAPATNLVMLDVRRCGNNQTPTIIARAGRSMYGLSGLSGRPLWRSEIDPGPTRALCSAVSADVPRVWTQPALRPWSTVCRQAWPTNPEGQFLKHAPAPLHYPDQPEEVRPLPWLGSQNPVLVVPLIGVLALVLAIAPGLLVSWSARHDRGGLGLFAVVCGMFGILLSSFASDTEVTLGVSVLVALAIPVQLAYWTFRRKTLQLHLLTMTGVAAVLGAFLYAYHPAPHHQRSLVILVQACMVALFMAVSSLPLLALIGLFATYLRRSQWARIGLLLGLSVILSVALAALMLSVDLRFKNATEQYVWDGWYMVWPLGTYVLGAIAIASWPFRNLWRRFAARSVDRPRRPFILIVAILLVLLAVFAILLLLLVPFAILW